MIYPSAGYHSCWLPAQPRSQPCSQPGAGRACQLTRHCAGGRLRMIVCAASDDRPVAATTDRSVSALRALAMPTDDSGSLEGSYLNLREESLQPSEVRPCLRQ